MFRILIQDEKDKQKWNYLKVKKEDTQQKGSVLNFVSILFQLIPETGCGQSPQSIINTEQFLNMPWCNQGKIKSQRHKTNYTLHKN